MAEVLKFPSEEKAEEARILAKGEKRLKKMIKSGFLQIVEVDGAKHFKIPCEKIAEWIDKGTVGGKAIKGDAAETIDRLILTTLTSVILKGTEYAVNGEEIEEFYIKRLASGDKNFYEWQKVQEQKMAKAMLKNKD